MGINQEPTAKTALHLEYKKEQKHTTLFVFKQASDNAFPTIPSRGTTWEPLLIVNLEIFLL